MTSRERSRSFAAMNFLDRHAGTIYCIMRIVIGLLFACHGGQKILHFPPPTKPMELDTMGLIGGYIELVGGFLIAFGLLTRAAAFLCCGMMAVAYFMVHAKMGSFFPLVNRGEAAVIYCFVFLYILFRGAGWLSLDALIGRSKTTTANTRA